MDTHPRTPLWRRWWIWLVTVAVIIATTVAVRAQRPKAPEYNLSAVARGDLEAKVTASGTLSALVTVDVGSQVSGRIQSLYADYNSAVKKGQLVAKIDPSNFEAQVAQARANVTAAEANLVRLQVQAEDAQRQLRRADELVTQKLIAESERDTVQANARAADAAALQGKGQLAQARAAQALAENNLRYTDIISPTDGIVISRSVNVGQTVAASLSAPVLFTIAQDLRQMEVHTNVAEADIGRLAEGMEASFSVDAFPGEQFRGKVQTIRNAPQTLQNVVTYDAVIQVGNPDLKLKPGMTAYVSVTYARSEDSLLVPNAALRFRPPAEQLAAMRKASNDKNAEGGGAQDERKERGRQRKHENGPRDRANVWILKNGALERVRVHTGTTDGSNTVIVEGELHEGDQLVTGIKGAPDEDQQKQQRQRQQQFRMF
jgi:HlyD family secretion protein